MATDYEQERTALSLYLKEVRSRPLLDTDRERELLQKLSRGHVEALNSLIESNLSFVVTIATQYRNLGVEFEDLLNEGNLGLIEAARRFDSTKGVKFITYAVWWIRKSILKALHDHSRIVRLPSSHTRKVQRVRRAETRLRQDLGREPTRHELSRHIGISPVAMDRLLRCALQAERVEVHRDEDGTSPLIDRLSNGQETGEERVLRREEMMLVTVAYCRLGPREQAVLALRLGFEGQPPMTLDKIGRLLRRSRERVRQIEHQAKRRLRRLLQNSRLLREAPRPSPD